jgi:hypothetical protein
MIIGEIEVLRRLHMLAMVYLLGGMGGVSDILQRCELQAEPR